MKSMLSEVRLERPIHDGYVSTESLIQELLEQQALLKPPSLQPWRLLSQRAHMSRNTPNLLPIRAV